MYCEKTKFIYVHLPKCAGTFLKHFLLSNLYEDYESNIDLAYYQKKHDTLGEFSLRGIIDKFNLDAGSYFKFTIVRNPWDRVVSMYNFLGGFKYNYIKTSGNETELLDAIKEFHWFYSRYDFDGFVDYCFKQEKIKEFHNGYFETYVDRLSLGGKIAVDKYYKQEDIDYMVNDLCQKMNFKSKKTFLDWRKNSSSAFKQADNYADYYSDRSKRVISKHFEKDIDFFQYAF